MCASRRLVGVLEYVLFSTSLNLIPTSPETGGLKLGCSLPTLQSLHYITLGYITIVTLPDHRLIHQKDLRKMSIIRQWPTAMSLCGPTRGQCGGQCGGHWTSPQSAMRTIILRGRNWSEELNIVTITQSASYSPFNSLVVTGPSIKLLVPAGVCWTGPDGVAQLQLSIRARQWPDLSCSHSQMCHQISRHHQFLW